MAKMVLAVDPGRAKCGLALLEGAVVIARAVVSREDLAGKIRGWSREFTISEVIVGNRTSASDVMEVVRKELPGLPVTLDDEAGTTLEARRLYFAEHPRRGWRRLVPVGLQVPPEPYDDYAAVVLARRRGR